MGCKAGQCNKTLAETIDKFAIINAKPCQNHDKVKQGIFFSFCHLSFFFPIHTVH